jgi:hypothetical protein
MDLLNLDRCLAKLVIGVRVGETIEKDSSSTSLELLLDDESILDLTWWDAVPRRISGPTGGPHGGRLTFILPEGEAAQGDEQGRASETERRCVARLWLDAVAKRQGVAPALDDLVRVVGARIEGIMVHEISRSTTRIVLFLDETGYFEAIGSAGDLDVMWYVPGKEARDRYGWPEQTDSALLYYRHEPCTTDLVQ